MRRREFVISAAAFSALPACLPTGNEPPPEEQPDPNAPGPEPEERFAPAAELDLGLFPSGLQVGDATQDSALLSVHTAEAVVAVTLARGVKDGWLEEVQLDDMPVEDGALQLRLEDLLPDTTYSVVVTTSDGAARSEVTRFRTAIPAGRSRVVRFGATSCLGGNVPWRTLSHAADEKLDFFLLNGDTVYADQRSNDQLRDLWEGAMRVQGMRDLTSSTSIIASWDDHEVGNNWSWTQPGMDVRVPIAIAEFKRALPQSAGGGPVGLWRKLSWGDVLDVVVMDSRGERENGNYISPEQMSFIQTTLKESTARFKVVLNTVPITDLADLVGDIQAEDRWQGFPAQRAELLDFIAAEGIEGILWVSGDFHLGAVGRVDAAGGAAANQWEVLAGPGGSPINPATNFLQPDRERYPVVLGSHTFCLFEADPDAGTVRVQFINDAGEVAADELLEV